MGNIFLIIACIVAGFILKKTPFFDEESNSVLNRLIIYFFIPLIAIYQVPKIEFSPTLIWLTLCPFIIFLASFLFFQIVSILTSIKRDTKAALILTSGISSTSFVGFPIFELLYGEPGLAYGVFMSLGGTILVFNTLGISTLFYFTEDNVDLIGLIKKIFKFIPFLAFVIGIFFNFFGIVYPQIVDELLLNLTRPFSVIALLSIGMQIDFRMPKSLLNSLLLGQFFKLIIAPIIIYLLVWTYFDIQGVLGKVCVLGSAIGSMNAMSILTAEKKINPPLSMLMPAVGIPISIPILFIIDQLLQ